MLQCVRGRLPIPNKIANAPELKTGVELYFIAFIELSSCRQLGYGSEGPIPWNITDRWCEVNEIEGEQREDMFYQVARLDEVYLKHRSKVVKKDIENAGSTR